MLTFPQCLHCKKKLLLLFLWITPHKNNKIKHLSIIDLKCKMYLMLIGNTLKVIKWSLILHTHVELSMQISIHYIPNQVFVLCLTSYKPANFVENYLINNRYWLIIGCLHYALVDIFGSSTLVKKVWSCVSTSLWY